MSRLALNTNREEETVITRAYPENPPKPLNGHIVIKECKPEMTAGGIYVGRSRSIEVKYIVHDLGDLSIEGLKAGDEIAVSGYGAEVMCARQIKRNEAGHEEEIVDFLLIRPEQVAGVYSAVTI
jgi:hypothetical protein